MIDNDKILFAKILAGDEEAVESAIRMWHGGFVGFLCSMVNEEDAQDIAQDIYLKFIKNVHKLNNLQHAKRFIYKSGYRKAVDFIRRRNIASKVIKDLAENMPVTHGVIDKTVNDTLQKGLDTLSAKERAVISLRFDSGMTTRETAQHLGIPQGTVLYRIHSAMGKLRKFFKKQGYAQVMEAKDEAR